MRKVYGYELISEFNNILQDIEDAFDYDFQLHCKIKELITKFLNQLSNYIEEL